MNCIIYCSMRSLVVISGCANEGEMSERLGVVGVHPENPAF